MSMLLTDNLSAHVSLLLLCGITGALAYFYARSFRLKLRVNFDGPIPHIKGLPILGCTGFISRRNEFIQESLDYVGDTLCKIDIPRSCVILTRGIEAQFVFLHHRSLSPRQGYLLLHPGGIGSWKDIKGMPSTPGGADGAWFQSRLMTMLRKGIIMDRYPLLLADIDRGQASFSNGVPVDIFRACYAINLQLLLRAVFPKEIAGDPTQAVKIVSLLSLAVGETNPLRFAFPWVPGLFKFTQLYYGSKVYLKFQEIVKQRQALNLKELDVVDFMIEKGDSLNQMISFLLGSTFAGLINNSRIEAWLLVYLCFHPEWKNKITQELNDLLAECSTKSGPEAMHDVPFERWASALPSLQACIIEMIRLKGDGALLRKNVSNSDVSIAGRAIPPGQYATYLMSDIHHNPLIYPDAHTFRPDREPAKTAEGVTFIGFGTGLHPCPGKDLALFIIKIIMANFLVKFDYELVDKAGAVLPESSMPASEKNSLHMPGLAVGETARIRFRSKEVS